MCGWIRRRYLRGDSSIVTAAAVAADVRVFVDGCCCCYCCWACVHFIPDIWDVYLFVSLIISKSEREKICLYIYFGLK